MGARDQANGRTLVHWARGLTDERLSELLDIAIIYGSMTGIRRRAIQSEAARRLRVYAKAHPETALHIRTTTTEEIP